MIRHGSISLLLALSKRIEKDQRKSFKRTPFFSSPYHFPFLSGEPNRNEKKNTGHSEKGELTAGQNDNGRFSSGRFAEDAEER